LESKRQKADAERTEAKLLASLSDEERQLAQQWLQGPFEIGEAG
jgi:hypothetical protein